MPWVNAFWIGVLSIPLAAGTARAAVAFDNAADHAYDSGFPNGSNGGSGFNPWHRADSGGAGAFIGSSGGNGGMGTIDITGRSFGLNAAANNQGGSTRSWLSRTFAQGALQPHQTFSFDLDMGTPLVTSQMVALAQFDTPTNNKTVGPGIYLGLTDYQIIDGPGQIFTPAMRDSGIPADQPIHALYTINTDNTYSVTLHSLTSPLTYSTSGPTSNFILDAFYAEVDSSASPAVDPAGALYFNNLGIDVPEPAGVFLLPLASVLCLGRRRKAASQALSTKTL